MKITQALLDDLTAKAKESPRLRMNMDLRNSESDQSQRMLNAIFVESSPCTEYWFLMHYMPGPSSKEYANYDAVAHELKKHISNYDKTEAFFNKTHIYCELKEQGDMEKVIELSRELDRLHETEPMIYKSYSQMYKLFDIIKGITKEDGTGDRHLYKP